MPPRALAHAFFVSRSLSRSIRTFCPWGEHGLVGRNPGGLVELRPSHHDAVVLLLDDPDIIKTTMISNANSMLWLAHNGLKPLDQKMGFDQRAIAVYNASVIYFGTLAPNIKSIGDLAGKRVALGKKGDTKVLGERWGVGFFKLLGKQAGFG